MEFLKNVEKAIETLKNTLHQMPGLTFPLETLQRGIENERVEISQATSPSSQHRITCQGDPAKWCLPYGRRLEELGVRILHTDGEAGASGEAATPTGGTAIVAKFPKVRHAEFSAAWREASRRWWGCAVWGFGLKRP
jgi:hypothetical protein